MDKGVAETVKDHKRKHDDDKDDDDKDPPSGPNQGKKTKRRRTKESESSKKPFTTKETPKGKAPSKGSKTGKSASAKELVQEPTVERVMDDANKIDWNNPKGDCYPFDLSKPLPLQGYPSHLTVAADYFFNNELEYLKSSDLKRMYITSITKTKAARYKIEGIEYMGEWRKLWHKSQLNKFSKHNVYSTKKILGVKIVSVKKLHGYGHLEEIIVKRADRQFYKFKEGDFVDLHLNEIEDILVPTVQHKLFHLINSDIFDFIVALCMFTRSLVIKKHVEDLQLGVESYQKKLNITIPRQTFPKIELKGLYTPSHKTPGVIYEDLTKQKRVMQDDELYKFSDETLKKVRDELHHRVCDFCLEYNKEMLRRKCMDIDRKLSKLMVELIDK
uniref:Uncharacterized protein n=1 Tax=Tanacetum cinerariifolium TaxID=118510 RepID=A0A699KFR5_TANCI|nr:hypothetical protein [Tanacetum cinerariifolium]